MATEQFVFWAFAFAGSVLAGWWFAVRPGATARDIATPVSCMLLILAVLLALLVLTGQDVGAFTVDVYHFVIGR